MNTLGPEVPLADTTKPGDALVRVGLKTIPVGAAGGLPPAGGGIVTTSGDPMGKGSPFPV
jgi:hypothetical protein